MSLLSAVDIESIFKLLFAVLLGGVIGFDREVAHKPAGLRTHMLVCGSSALLVSLGISLDLLYVSEVGNAVIRTDPIRVIGAIFTGISFLGAGTILRNKKGPVEGLTTAASLLFVSTVGIAVGVGAYVVAVAATLVAVLILVVGLRLEKWLDIRHP